MNKQICEEVTFRKLEIFLAYMNSGSLAKAAEHLEVSAVSVHRALHSLEYGMRCALFRHEGRNLIPTEAAKSFARVAVDVLENMSQGIQSAREMGGQYADKLRLGSLYSLTASMVPRIVVDMKIRRPMLNMELVLGSNVDLTEKLKLGQIDATIMAILSKDPEIEAISLFKDNLFFAAPADSAFSAREFIGLDELRDTPFVSLAGGFATSKNLHEAFARAGFAPRIAMEVGDIFSLMNLVMGGIGYALLPGRVHNLFGEQIQFIPLEEKFQVHQTIGLCHLKLREHDPNLLALAATCRMVSRSNIAPKPII